MGDVFVKTMIMFVLAFIISMFVALLISWIRRLLTSVKMNSFFDERSKRLVRRAINIHKIHHRQLNLISEAIEKQEHSELFDFYEGVNDDFEPSEDYHGTLKLMPRRKRNTRKHKHIQPKSK
jgi:hypothetical protein